MLNIKSYPVKFWGALIFIYIVLLEFVLPGINYFPKPSLIFESLMALFSDYNLLQALLSSLGVMTFAFYGAMILIYLTAGIIILFFSNFEMFAGILRIINYPAMFIAIMITAFLFQNLIAAEFLFMLFSFIAIAKKYMSEEIKKVPEEYILSARSLGYSENKIRNSVIWKAIQPAVFGRIINKLGFFWISLFIFEFAAKSSGIGELFFSLISYNDYTGLLALSLFTAIIIWGFNLIVSWLNNKIYFWGKS